MTIIRYLHLPLMLTPTPSNPRALIRRIRGILLPERNNNRIVGVRIHRRSILTVVENLVLLAVRLYGVASHSSFFQLDYVGIHVECVVHVLRVCWRSLSCAQSGFVWVLVIGVAVAVALVVLLVNVRVGFHWSSDCSSCDCVRDCRCKRPC
jgi:hypothetical protein